MNTLLARRSTNLHPVSASMWLVPGSGSPPSPASCTEAFGQSNLGHRVDHANSVCIRKYLHNVIDRASQLIGSLLGNSDAPEDVRGLVTPSMLHAPAYFISAR